MGLKIGVMHKCDEREFDECDGHMAHGSTHGSMHVHVEVLVLVYAVVVGRDAGELRFCHYVCTFTPQQAACAQNAVCVTLEVVRKLRSHTSEIPAQFRHISTSISTIATAFDVGSKRSFNNRAHC